MHRTYEKGDEVGYYNIWGFDERKRMSPQWEQSANPEAQLSQHPHGFSTGCSPIDLRSQPIDDANAQDDANDFPTQMPIRSSFPWDHGPFNQNQFLQMILQMLRWIFRPPDVPLSRHRQSTATPSMPFYHLHHLSKLTFMPFSPGP